MGSNPHRAPLSEPSSQKSTARSLSGSGEEKVTNEVREAMRADIATPASSSRATDTRTPSRATRYTIVMEASPPTKAARGIVRALLSRGGRKPR